MQSLLDKLDKINFNAYSDKKLTSQEGWGVSYSINLTDTHGICESMFQVVVRVTYQGALVSHYGCVTTQETNLFGLWFLVKKSKVQNDEYKEQRQNELNGQALFNLLG
jgi:hypothetical protein